MELADCRRRCPQCGVSGGILPVLAEEAAQQWTGRFNPRPVAEADLLSLYEAALLIRELPMRPSTRRRCSPDPS